MVEGYPGQDLGRPESGPRSLARPGRRIGSLLIDWLVCLLIAAGYSDAFGATAGREFYPLVVLLIENLLLIPTAGATIGQRLLGVQTERLDDGRLGLAAVAVRAVLLCLVVPPLTLIWDRNLRGGHDLAAGALVTRSR